ncbi:MAG TPA: recombinase family protein [Kineosporiaceae bacterium]
MSEHPKIRPGHLQRAAIVYVRQSTLAQVEHNRESTVRQYDLAERAVAWGWPRAAVRVIDEDLGVSGTSTAGRSGFAQVTAMVALGQVGIVLALECSRLARNNADWYRLLDLAGMTDTLIGDADGLYHPGQFNDRLVLGMKGTMSECEIHILRARLAGGIASKASRGELQRALPVGLVWTDPRGRDDPGRVQLHPDEAVRGVIAAIFERFAVAGSVRATWLWLREQGLKFPLMPVVYMHDLGEITWVAPTYHAVHTVLTHPAYAGAYVYGRTAQRRRIDPDGTVHVSRHLLPRDQWQVCIPGHHTGYIDWDTYLANQERIRTNIRPERHAAGTGAVREGCALLQGLAVCATCGRKLAVFYQGKTKSKPGYYCNGTAELVDGKGVRHLTTGGAGIDTAVAQAVLDAMAPAALEAALAAAEDLEHGHETVLAQHAREVERARYEASRAERRYRAVDPDNRLVARGLEADWEKALTALAATEDALEQRRRRRPAPLTPDERSQVLALASDLPSVWDAPTTTDKDRKQLLHALLEEVVITITRSPGAGQADLLLRWKGGATSDLTLTMRRAQPAIRTSDDTIDLIRRLAVHHPDAVIAGILNRQGKRTARGLSYTASRVQSLRYHRDIPAYQPHARTAEGDLLTVADAAKTLGTAPSTLHRWINDGFIPAEQDTPGAPWRIRLTPNLRALFVDTAPDGWLVMQDATKALGISRQTVLQRVKRGELQAVHVTTGRRKGLRINVSPPQQGLF